jgi:hypothetical protein
MRALYISIIFCLVSCGGRGSLKTEYVQEEPFYTIDLDIVENEKNVGISEFFTDAEVIVLEVTDRSLLVSVDKIYAKGDTLLIMDRRAKGMLAFDTQGRFLFRVGSVGRGPGEYNSLSDFSVDPKNGRIYVLDPNAGLINEYGIEDGKFIGTIRIRDNDKVRTNYLYYYKDGIYTDTYFYKKPKDNYLLRRLDVKSGEETGHWLSQDAYNLGWNEMYYTGKSPFIYGNDSLFRFVQPFMDRITTISNNGIEHSIGLKSKNMVAANDLGVEGHSDARDKYESLMRSGKVYNIQNYAEFGQNIWFTYHLGNRLRTVLYCKETNQVRIANILIDDLTYVPSAQKYCFISEIDLLNKSAYSVFGAQKLFVDYNEGKISGNLKGVEKLAALSESSNPVIIKYRYE